jgi:nitric oxide reductase NorQ protein
MQLDTIKPFYNEIKRICIQSADGTILYRTELEPYQGLSIKEAKQTIENDSVLTWNELTCAWEVCTDDAVLMRFHKSEALPQDEHAVPQELDDETQQLRSFIHSQEAQDLKPAELYIEPLKWKYALRSVIRAQNVMIVGPTGAGKTMLVKWIAEALQRPLHVFNLGSTQDPRATLIGNTHFDTSKGTFFNQSAFIEAVQQPNAVILLDELSRANPEAFNILMTALDKNQRYIRLDETIDSKVIEIDPTVTFIATANVGSEYTSTRVIDRALQDRFVTIEMNYLDLEGEAHVLGQLFPMLDESSRYTICKLASHIRTSVDSEDSIVERSISTRHTIELASLLVDGFTLEEALDIVLYPSYSNDGGVESERTYIKQLVQAVIGVKEDSPF